MSNKDQFNDGSSVNVSANPHLDELIAVRVSRRSALKGGVGLTASVLLGGTGLAACGSGGDSASDNPLSLGFTAVPKNKNDKVTVPDGYQVSILHSLGDPLGAADAAWKGDGTETAESYNRRISDGHDGRYFFGMTDAGRVQADS